MIRAQFLLLVVSDSRWVFHSGGRGIFFPFSVSFNRVRVVCWVHPFAVELYDGSLCFGEVLSLVFLSVENLGHVGDGWVEESGCLFAFPFISFVMHFFIFFFEGGILFGLGGVSGMPGDGVAP